MLKSNLILALYKLYIKLLNCKMSLILVFCFLFLLFSLIVDEKKFSKNVGIAQNPFIATTIKNILIPMNGANIIDNPKVGNIKTTITNPKVFN